MYALQGYPEYFTQQYLLRQVLSECFVTPAVDASMRVAMPKVNREAMAEFPMIIPPKSEQEEIVGWLDGRLADVRAPEKATQKEIATLNEFKQTLIANAVTGKIKI
jgi:type I restriction enzyme S subunit